MAHYLFEDQPATLAQMPTETLVQLNRDVRAELDSRGLLARDVVSAKACAVCYSPKVLWGVEIDGREICAECLKKLSPVDYDAWLNKMLEAGLDARP